MGDRQYWRALGLDSATANKRPNAEGFFKVKALHRPDKNPSLSVQPDDGDGAGWFHDFGTGERGTLYEYCRQCGIDTGTHDAKPTRPEPMTLAEWAAARKLTAETLADFGVTETRTGEIRFPTPCGVDRVRGITTGKSAPRWAKRGGMACAYGMDVTAFNSGPIYLVEGEPSVWACHQAGVRAVSALVGATGDIGPIVAELVSDGAEIRIAYDADAAGKAGAAKAFAALSAAGATVRIVELPARKRGFDVDDLHRAEGSRLAAALDELCGEDSPELPPGYALPGALVRVIDDDAEAVVAECRIDVTNVGIDVDDGRHVWRIEWHGRTLDVPRADLAATRSIVAWSDYGMPVDQHTAGELVRYLTAYEQHNRQRITRQETSASTGWFGDCYLRGKHRHGRACPYYRAGDAGRDQWVDGLEAAGDESLWHAALERALARPVVRLMVAGALASTLTQRAGLEVAVIDLAGTTSQGKTSALRVALAALGDPWRLLRSWDTTRIAVERAAAYSRGLTLAFDDTMRARKIEDVAGAIYDVTSGVSRARGSKVGGLQAAPRSHSWLLSTGEGPIINMAEGFGGIWSRVLTVTAPAWGGVSADLGVEIRGILNVLREHYGHGLPALVERLASIEPAELRARHAALVDSFASRIYDRHPGHVAGDRIAQALAALELTGREFGAACGFNVNDWVDRGLADSIALKSSKADRAVDALDEVLTSAAAQLGRIFRAPSQAEPPAGWIGAGECDEAGFTELALAPAFVRDTLRRAGFEPGAVVASWAERGWIIRDGKRLTHKVKCGDGRPRFYKFGKLS